ncbi:hypothetical protein SAMN05428974_3812 [Sphingopyxis sp. YR583]|nr:hypothetical protein SAMN05428974_3812 [Sphingopyxis sp. YR583]
MGKLIQLVRRHLVAQPLIQYFDARVDLYRGLDFAKPIQNRKLRV